METINEYQITEYIKKSSTIASKSRLKLSKLKLKCKSKKKFDHSNSLQTTNKTREDTSISRINSINPSSEYLAASPSQKHKKIVTFVPNFRLINYVYYNPNDVIHEEEKQKEKENEQKIKEREDVPKKKVTNDKVTFQCSCVIM